MKRVALLLAAACLLSAASAQWLERTFWLTDSFPSLGDPRMAYVNPLSGRLYVSQAHGLPTLIYDCSSHTKHRSARDFNLPIQYIPTTGLLYVGSCDDRRVTTFDAAADTQTTLTLCTVDQLHALAVDRVRAKVYASDDNADVYVFDGRTGQTLSVIDTWNPADRMAWDSATGRLFCGGSECWRYICVIDCASDSLIGEIEGATADDMVLHPSRPELITAAGSKVYFSSTESLVVLDSIMLPFRISDRGLVVDRQSNRLYALYLSDPRPTFDWWLGVIDLTTDSLLRVLNVGEILGVADAVVAEPPSGSKLYLRDAVSDSLIVLSPDGEIIGGLHLGTNMEDASGCAWHPGLNRLYAASVDTLFGVDCAADTVVETVDCSKIRVTWMRWLSLVGRLYAGNDAGVGWIGASDSLERWVDRAGLELADVDPGRGRLYLHGDGVLCVYDCAADTFVRSADCPGVLYSALLLPEFGKLYLMMESGTLRAFDTRGDSFLPSMSVPFGRLRYNPTTRRLYSGTVHFCEIDPAADSVLQTMTVPGVADYVVNPVNNELWMLHKNGITVVACDSFRTVQTIELPGWNVRMVLDAVHNKLYCLRYDTRGTVIDCANYRVSDTIRTPYWYGGAFIDSAHERLYLSVREGQAVIDTRTDSTLAMIAAPGSILGSDPADNVLYAYHGALDQVSVIRDNPPGVVESRTLDATRATPAATVIGRVLTLPSSPVPRPSSLLLDATGRKVLALKPGPNDVSSLAPGIYFVRQKRSSGQAVQWSSEKVVITR